MNFASNYPKDTSPTMLLLPLAVDKNRANYFQALALCGHSRRKLLTRLADAHMHMPTPQSQNGVDTDVSNRVQLN